MFDYRSRSSATTGERIGSSGPPNLRPTVPARFEALDLRRGPSAANAERGRDRQQTADMRRTKLGERSARRRHEAKTYDVVGLDEVGDTSSAAPASRSSCSRGQQITDREGKFDQTPGRPPTASRRSSCATGSRGSCPARCRWRRATRRRQRRPTTSRTNSRSSGSRCWCSRGSSLFVGGFLIFNTFSITVAQRRGSSACSGRSERRGARSDRRWGSRRCPRGPRPVVGIAGGVGFVVAINELFKAVGIDLPTTGTVIAAQHRDRRRSSSASS